MRSDHAEPLNLGSEEMVSINELAELAISISGKRDIEIRHVDGPQGVRGRNSDNSRLRKVLGWEPPRPWRTALPHLPVDREAAGRSMSGAPRAARRWRRGRTMGPCPRSCWSGRCRRLHGQALANRYLVEGSYDRLQLHHVPMRFSSELADVGRFRWTKVLRLPEVILRAWWSALRHRRDALVVAVGLRNRLPLLRDSAVLLAARPLFRDSAPRPQRGWAEQLRGLPAPLAMLVRRAYGGWISSSTSTSPCRTTSLPAPRRVGYLPYGVEGPPPCHKAAARR